MHLLDNDRQTVRRRLHSGSDGEPQPPAIDQAKGL
jgi:hypothetical protein